MRLVVSDLAVDLIGNYPQVVLTGDFGHPLQLFTAVDVPGGVARRGQGNAPGLGGNGFFQGRAGQAKAVGCRLLDGRDARPGSVDARLIGQVHRLRHQHFVAMAEQAQRGGEQAVLRTGHQGHVIGVYGDALQTALLGRNRLAQGRSAEDMGVVSVAGAQGVDGGFANGTGGGEVGIADAQHNHIFATATGFDGRVVNIPGADGLATNALDKR